MSDERLRELERVWKESGLDDDEATYLRERVRLGDLPDEMLRLAAHCGHPAAAQTLDLRAAPLDRQAQDAWAEDFALCTGGPGYVRATIAAARVAMPTLDLYGVTDPRPLEMLDAVVAWVRNPTPEALATISQLRERYDSVPRACGESQATEISYRATVDAARTPWFVANSVVSEEAVGWAGGWLAGCLMAARGALCCTDEGLQSPENALNHARTDPAIARTVFDAVAEVAPWALGYGDPLEEFAEPSEEPS